MKKGCLIALILIGCLPLGFCAAYNYHAARSVLPPELEIEEVIFYGEEGVIMEGCAYGVYRLTAKGVAHLREAGLVSPTPLKLTDWDKLPDGTRLQALGAPSCVKASTRAPSAQDTLTKPGGYYKMLSGGEGLILADPKSRLAWFLYAD